jgi:hypothetical protein
MRLLSIFSASLALFATGFAQGPDFGGNAQREALKKLSGLTGEWSGTGWAELGGRRSEFKSVEIVTPKAGGAVLAVEGEHWIEVGERKIPVHLAFATIRYDEKEKKYTMRANLSTGLEKVYPIEVLENGYRWSQRSTDLGDVTYVATFRGNSWVEYGEVVRDGKAVRVYEMRLTRK